MNPWDRQTMLEETYLGMWGIRPEVYYQRLSGNSYNIKLKYKGKEVVLQEVMEKGLTKTATSTYEGKVTLHKSMYDAETEATRILKE
jgi:hypothetical protein